MVLSKQYNFWFVFIVLSFLAAALSYQYGHQVFSFVSLSISTDKKQILENAQKLAAELNWNVEHYHHVISFDSQDDLQCFVELEAGGKEAFVDLFQSGKYDPFYWNVRFFKEKEIVEMNLWFSPQGKKLGFSQKIPEQTPGPALNQQQAEALVKTVIDDWCSDFNAYTLIEYDNEKRDTGRIDHSFTYERTDMTIGEGLYRFSAVVCGDTITKLEPSIKIPDNFMRRYQHMRSANNLIAAVGIFFFKFIYIFLLSLFGLVFFYRRNFLLFKQSAYVSLCIATGMFLSGFNNYSLWWLSYNTIQSMYSFVLMKVLGQFVLFIYFFIIVFFTLVIAEAAGRFIYKKHIQFFQIFTFFGITSYEVVHQVMLGYLLVPFLFLYEVGFSYITKIYLGWWTPASSLFEPNIIASFFPWLEAISKGLYAGFFEEVVFRALPFAMTAVLFCNHKHKKVWFILAYILQAFIFGACHANYPNQPSYARLVEILPISCIFGWIYIQFGLLPGVITHFVYDAIWFAMPIFTSNLFWSKIIVIALIGLPLLVVFAIFLSKRKLCDVSSKCLNQAFLGIEPAPITVQPRIIGKPIPSQHQALVIVLGFVGLLLWIMTFKFNIDADPLLITKSQAIEIARQAINDTWNVDLDQNWTALAVTQDDCSSIPTRFIWQKYGKQLYKLLEGSYVAGIYWKVSFVQFSGSVEDRAERYDVVISTSQIDKHLPRRSLLYYPGHVIEINHQLPEHFTGADIDQVAAEKIAYEYIEKEYGIEKNDTAFISVTSEKFEHRRDWTIIAQDTKVFDFEQGGQARIKIRISGDQVTSFLRFIFVPEDWNRGEIEKLTNLNLFKGILLFLMFCFIAIGFVLASLSLPSTRYGHQIFKHIIFVVGGISFAYMINSYSALITGFTTAEPFYDQLTRLFLAMASGLLWQLLLYAILLAAGAVQLIRPVRSNMFASLVVAFAIGFMIMGANSLIYFYQSYLEPVVGPHGLSAHINSTFACGCMYLIKLYSLLAMVIALFIVVKNFSKLTSFWLWQLLIIMLFFISLESMQSGISIEWMMIHAIILGLVVYLNYYLALQYDMTLLPLVCGIIVFTSIVPDVIYPVYYGASMDALVAVFAILISSLFFYQQSHVE